MTALKNVNFMGQAKYATTTPASDELYVVAGGGEVDYASGVSIAASTTYTAPSDGLLTVSSYHGDQANNNLTINGVQVYSATQGEKYGDGYTPPTQYLVGYGDTIVSNRAATFYPIR